MKVHGYKNTEDDKLLSLNEASIYCTIEELEKLINFLKYVKDEFLKDDNFKYQCHEHYRDWDNNWTKESSDIIIIINNEKFEK